MEVELRAFSTENSQLPKVQARTQKRWNPRRDEINQGRQAKLDKANQEHTGHTTLMRGISSNSITYRISHLCHWAVLTVFIPFPLGKLPEWIKEPFVYYIISASTLFSKNLYLLCLFHFVLIWQDFPHEKPTMNHWRFRMTSSHLPCKQCPIHFNIKCSKLPSDTQNWP